MGREVVSLDVVNLPIKVLLAPVARAGADAAPTLSAGVPDGRRRHGLSHVIRYPALRAAEDQLVESVIRCGRDDRPLDQRTRTAIGSPDRLGAEGSADASARADLVIHSAATAAPIAPYSVTSPGSRSFNASAATGPAPTRAKSLRRSRSARRTRPAVSARRSGTSSRQVTCCRKRIPHPRHADSPGVRRGVNRCLVRSDR